MGPKRQEYAGVLRNSLFSKVQSHIHDVSFCRTLCQGNSGDTLLISRCFPGNAGIGLLAKQHGDWEVASRVTEETSCQM
jgi:hypothetical protein